MPITYTNPSAGKILKEPLLKKVRALYRSPRKSITENLYAQQMSIDINRVYLALEILNTAIVNKVQIFFAKGSEDTHITGGYGKFKEYTDLQNYRSIL